MVKGLDISHNNDPKINIAKYVSQGIDFIWIKATQGLTYQDPMFQTYWQEAKQFRGAQLKVGAYHFFDPQVDGITQAKNALSRGVNFSLPGVLPLCVDVEDLTSHTPGQAAILNKWVANNYTICLQRLQDFLGHVKEHTGKDCVIYTYNGYMREYYRSHPFPNNPMWLSSLQAACPVRYDTKKLPEMWQNTYRYNGTDLDGDFFTGTQQQLNTLANIT
jgi:lysozyme